MGAEQGWFAELADAGQLTPQIVDGILLKHGDRGRKAIEAVGEHRVKQYNDFTVVVGWHDEYIVEDGGCECPDVQYNLDVDNPDELCWHALASMIADALDEADEYDEWYAEIADLL